MIRLWILTAVAILTASIGVVHDAGAASKTVAIQAVRAGSSVSAAEEFVMLRNYSDTAVDVSGWKIVYTSASGVTNTTLVTMTAAPPDHVLLPPHASETYFSSTLATNLAVDVAANRFTPGLNASSGTITVIDASNAIIDRIGWGTAALYESAPVTALGTQVVWRSQADTDSNSDDFAFFVPDENVELSYGGLIDVTDLCLNLAGIQDIVPSELIRLDDGSCVLPDRCSNLDGIQEVIPEGYESQDDGTCHEIDQCANIEGVQADVSIYEVVGSNCYPPFTAVDLRLNELLPNPDGIDAGNEFIELFNNADVDVDLSDYRLKIGSTVYLFPENSLIPAHGYIVFSDAELGLTFVNGSGKQIDLIGRDMTLVDELPAYSNAPDDQSWVLIDDMWQYTNNPTPGEPNAATQMLGSGAVVTTGLAPCPAGKYRNPETNRCKSITTTTSTLTPCRSDQYRNPLTNRCKSIAAELSSLVPCKTGQVRNPETNRCRSVATLSSTLKPCSPGQERNPDTNRCRKSSSVTPTAASFPVEPVQDAAATFTAWWALGGVVALGIGYAGWEYRYEISAFVKRIVTRGKS